MARGKVKLELIAERNKRKSTWKKRGAGLKKKMNEVTTLCDVNGCLVMYPLEEDREPIVWPSDNGAREVMAEFLHKNDLERSKKMANQESHMREMVAKAAAKLEKQRQEIKVKEAKLAMIKCFEIGMIPNYLSLNDANSMGNVIDDYLSDIDSWMKNLEMDEKEANQNQAAITNAGTSRKGKEPMNYD